MGSEHRWAVGRRFRGKTFHFYIMKSSKKKRWNLFLIFGIDEQMQINVRSPVDSILLRIQSGICLCKIKVARQIKLVTFVQSHMNIR